MLARPTAPLSFWECSACSLNDESAEECLHKIYLIRDGLNSIFVAGLLYNQLLRRCICSLSQYSTLATSSKLFQSVYNVQQSSGWPQFVAQVQIMIKIVKELYGCLCGAFTINGINICQLVFQLSYYNSSSNCDLAF